MKKKSEILDPAITISSPLKIPKTPEGINSVKQSLRNLSKEYDLDPDSVTGRCGEPHMSYELIDELFKKLKSIAENELKSLFTNNKKTIHINMKGKQEISDLECIIKVDKKGVFSILEDQEKDIKPFISGSKEVCLSPEDLQKYFCWTSTVYVSGR